MISFSSSKADKMTCKMRSKVSDLKKTWRLVARCYFYRQRPNLSSIEWNKRPSSWPNVNSGCWLRSRRISNPKDGFWKRSIRKKCPKRKYSRKMRTFSKSGGLRFRWLPATIGMWSLMNVGFSLLIWPLTFFPIFLLYIFFAITLGVWRFIFLHKADKMMCKRRSKVPSLWETWRLVVRCYFYCQRPNLGQTMSR